MKNPKNIYSDIYEPEEDSQLLLENTIKQVTQIQQKTSKNLKICEVGVGSGFVVSNIAKTNPINKFYGTDINPSAIEFTKKEFEKLKEKIVIKKTNLLEGFTQKFDVIIFNTPYLPCEKGEKYEELTLKDKAIYGGKLGYEVIEKFILQVNDKLKNDGFAVMVFSSYSNFKHIKKVLKQNQFKFKMLEEKQVFFETLYCLRFEKSDLLKRILDKQIKNVRYFAKGKHSVILEGKYNKSDVIIKTGEAEHLQTESLFLEKLNGESFVPKVYFSEDSFVVMEKLRGLTIKQFLDEEKSKRKIKIVLNEILKVTRRLDTLQINKFELTNPYKHIFVDKNLDVKFIDFERCIYSQTPKNTTQFLQYIRNNIPILETKGIKIDKGKIFEVSKEYKKKSFEVVVEKLEKL